MSEFKKGDRVQVNANCPARRFAGRYGTVAYEDSSANHVYSVGVHVDDDPEFTFRNFQPAELRFVAPSSDPTTLRLEDVRTGDEITVEGEDYLITARARKLSDGSLRILDRLRLSAALSGAWIDPDGNRVTLTAHTPAEPEWHRAKVIKAANTVGVGGPDDQMIMLRDYDGNFLNEYGSTFDPSDLTNVTIVMDEHEQVRA